MLKELLSANIDLYIDQGDTYYKVFTIRDNTGTVINLTGLEVTASLKRYFNVGTDYPLTAEITDAVGGKVTLSMTEVDTSDLVYDRYVYNVKLSDGTDTTKIMSGQALVTPV
jgi:hypothetical protein